MTRQQRRLIIISGMSGAGKTIALNTLEDIGLYCVDNLPVSLLPEFARQIADDVIKPRTDIAVGIDARSPVDDLKLLPEIINDLKKGGLSVELVFIVAQDEILTRRFSETRRKHPLSSRSIALAEAISKERHIMEGLSGQADIRIDTSHTLLHELREIVGKRIGQRPVSELSLQFQSFGYKHGVPADADYLFDVRCLPNPYWDENLRELNGKDETVIAFLSGSEQVQKMIDQIGNFLKYWLPMFEKENRSYMSVAIGCTGGQHRSVYIVEQLAMQIRDAGKNVIIIHRDMR